MEEEIKNRLQKYRAKKQREEKFEQFKKAINRFWMLGTGASNEDGKENTTIKISNADASKSRIESTHSDKLILEDDAALAFSSEEENDETTTNETNVDNKVFKYTLRAIGTLFWITLYVIAIKLKFGIVYLMFSALFGLYFNTRTAPKKRNEISAYSVFNKNCESIDGTLKAEQFEREIRFGAASVK